MGEWTHFNEGDHVPNDGEYMEIGENAFHMGINNPKTVTLRKGDTFRQQAIIIANGIKKAANGCSFSIKMR